MLNYIQTGLIMASVLTQFKYHHMDVKNVDGTKRDAKNV